MRDPEWRCYFCGDVFRDHASAGAHFGTLAASLPACRIKASEGGLVKALREAEEEAHEAICRVHSESAEGINAYRNNLSRHRAALTAVEETAFKAGYDEAVGTIERLRRIVVEYGARIRMASCARSDWQIEIDEAFRFVADQPETALSTLADSDGDDGS